MALWDGDSESARAHLGRGLELVRKERDRYHECKCLIYLARLELERDRPQQALLHCKELLPVASGMGEGNEAPAATVLEALAEVALGSAEADTKLGAGCRIGERSLAFSGHPFRTGLVGASVRCRRLPGAPRKARPRSRQTRDEVSSLRYVGLGSTPDESWLPQR